jgi:hypothetical protein
VTLCIGVGLCDCVAGDPQGVCEYDLISEYPRRVFFTLGDWGRLSHHIGVGSL